MKKNHEVVMLINNKAYCGQGEDLFDVWKQVVKEAEIDLPNPIDKESWEKIFDFDMYVDKEHAAHGFYIVDRYFDPYTPEQPFWNQYLTWDNEDEA